MDSKWPIFSRMSRTEKAGNKQVAALISPSVKNSMYWKWESLNFGHQSHNFNWKPVKWVSYFC